MYVSKDFLLSELPPCRDEWVIVAKRQEVIRDIIPEMVGAYTEFAQYYDRIGLFFEGSSIRQTCDNLYDFCKQELEYREEPEEWQTSALPAGILTRGFCDCKGYASFIGGCLGAIARATGEPIDWYYCFASYKEDKPTPYHVFVVVETPDGPLWVDPTPGSRSMEPEHTICEKPQEPAGTRNISGMVTSEGELVYAAVGTTGDPAADAALSVATQISNTINKGKVRGTYFGDWLSDFARPGQAWNDLVHLITGYKYTDGDYALGEIFMNRVLNENTYNRWDTPDGLIPIAWYYFTELFGIPIAVNTDFDNINTGSLAAYLAGRPEQAGYVSQEQVTRAYNLLQLLGHDDKMIQWPPADFGLMPYVAPIPDARIPGQLYNGALPNGQQIQNGIPITAATSGSDVQVPGSGGAAPVENNTGKIVLIVAAVLGLLLLIENE